MKRKSRITQGMSRSRLILESFLACRYASSSCSIACGVSFAGVGWKRMCLWPCKSTSRMALSSVLYDPPHSYPATDINVLFSQRMSLSGSRIWISDTNRIQGISISVDFGFAVVQRSAVSIHDGSDAPVAGDKSLNCIGAFDGLCFGDGFQFSIGFRIFDFLNTGHCLNEAMAEARLTKFAGNSPHPKKD